MENRIPHNPDAEKAVLGCIMIDPQVYYEVSELITSDDFHRAFNGQVMRAMSSLVESSRDIDFLTVKAALEAAGVATQNGIDVELIDFINAVPTSINASAYASIVSEFSTRRKLLRAASAIATAAYDTERGIDSVVDIADAEMLAVTNGTRRGVITLGESLGSFYDAIEARKANPGGLVGLPTGFIEFDKLKRGLKPAEMIVLAGRPGMGKSSFERQIALNVARLGKRVIRFNMEMSQEQSNLRLVAAEIGVDMRRLESADMTPPEWNRYYEAVGRLSELPIFLDHSPAQTIATVRAKCRRVWAEHGLDLITIDYLQLLGGERSSSNRVNEIGEISRGLKKLALELNVPILALAQLNRAVEQRADKHPQLSDLRESGDIENDADCVVFVYRDDVYNPNDSDRPNTADLTVAKNRQGATGTIELFWNGKLTRFSNLQRDTIEL